MNKFTAGRHIYERPTTYVCQVKPEQPLLSGSADQQVTTLDIEPDEEWPVNPSTGHYFDPW